MFLFSCRNLIGIHIRTHLYSQLYQAIENMPIHIFFRNQFWLIFVFYNSIIHNHILYIILNYVYSNKKSTADTVLSIV